MAAIQQPQQPMQQQLPGPPLNEQQPTSVFDSFSSSLRGNVVRSNGVVDQSFRGNNAGPAANSLINSWNTCAWVVRYSRYTSYIITILVTFTLLACIVGWGNGLILTLTLLTLLFAAFQSYISSQDACFRLFGNVAD